MFNIAPENDGWKTILSFWEGNFSGVMLNFCLIIADFITITISNLTRLIFAFGLLRIFWAGLLGSKTDTDFLVGGFTVGIVWSKHPVSLSANRG